MLQMRCSLRIYLYDSEMGKTGRYLWRMRRILPGPSLRSGVYGFSFHLQRQHENISKHYLSLFASRSGHRFPSLCLSFHFDVEIPALGSDICYLLNEMIYTGVSLVMLCCTYINTYSKAGQRCVYLMRQCHCHFASTNAHS